VAAGQSETTKSVRHAASVIRRWWLLIAIGTVLALAFGAGASIGSRTHFTAETQVVVTQPAQMLLPRNESAVQRLADLMETVRALATSDDVLERASGPAGRSLQFMRDHVTARVVQGSLILTIRADFPTRAEAESVAVRVVELLDERLGSFASSSSDPTTQLTIESVRAPVVTKVPSTLPRTLAVAFVLGFGFSVLAAFALDDS
jgi:capsular polysaccharide biosynthesis protein